MNKQIDVTNLRKACPLPNLLHLVGLGQYAKSSCISPFCKQQKASWRLFQYEGRWMYKDFCSGELGDEIGLLARINKLDPHADFAAVLKIYQDIVKGKRKGKNKGAKTKAPVSLSRPISNTKPNATGFGPGTYEQLEKVSQLRGISMEGLLFAQEMGVLVFGSPWGFDVYAVRDQTGQLVEARCLNGNNFGASGDLPVRTGHVLSGSQLDWPLGVLEAKECEYLALVQGAVEFLTLHQYVVQERAQDRVGPVGMLSLNLIASDALQHFKGRHVRIYPCCDKPGIDAAIRWQEQLQKAGAKNVDGFNFGALKSAEGRPVKDLCEFNRLKLGGSDFAERTILP